MRRNDDKVIVYAMMIAVVVAILVAFSACSSGTGPAQQGPGIEIDVDHHGKTKRPSVQTKKPSTGFFGGSGGVNKYSKKSRR